MVPDPAKTGLGLEYFCSEGDKVWSMKDEDLIDLGRRELAKLGVTGSAPVIDGTVVMIENIYRELALREGNRSPNGQPRDNARN